MNILTNILSSRSRSEIFRLLFDGSERELYVRELERLSGLNVMTIKNEIGNLSELDLITCRHSGNRHYYRANTEHQLYSDIESIVSKTTGIIPHLKNILNDKRIKLAFIFGSFARREEKTVSDIDLFVVGNLRMRELSHLLSGCQEKFNREINPHIISADKLKERCKKPDSFISRVAASEKALIIGTRNDLEQICG